MSFSDSFRLYRNFLMTINLQHFCMQEFRSYPVTKITTLSHNVKAYEISLPSPDHETVCPIHLFVYPTKNSY